MPTATFAASRQAGTRRPGARRLITTAVLATAVLAAAVACSGNRSGDTAGDAASTVHNLGAVPIPSPPTAQATPTADENHLQLVAMGAPVKVVLPRAAAVVTATGPVEDLPNTFTTPPDDTTGTITIHLADVTGTLTIRAGDFTSRDEQGRDIALRPAAANSVTATTGHAATLGIVGTFQAGAAQLTWRHNGKVVAVWDFNIELD